MAFFSIDHISIKGIASCIPSKVIESKNYPFHTKIESKQFIKTTGIEERRVVEEGTTASDLCLKAANELLNRLDWNREEVQVLVFVSQTPDYKIPCTATILQNKLNLPKTCLAFDVNLGCSGYVYGLSIVAALIEKIQGKALLLVGDASSICISEQDKSTAPLFSDAGSATALQYDSKAPSTFFNLQSDGEGFDAIISKDGGARHPISETSFVMNKHTGRRDVDMFLDGIKVFNFSRREVVPNVKELLNQAKLNMDCFDYFVFHQANKLMNDGIAKKLNLPMAKVPLSLKKLGNTGAASIPVTITSEIQTETNLKSSKILLSGFGVGLSWGSCIISLENSLVLPIIEL